MRILYFVQYFNLPDEAGGSRAYQFARTWAAEGHQVTVVTGAVNYKTMSIPEKYRGRLITEETVDRVRLLRVWAYPEVRGSLRKRYINFASYAAMAIIASIFRAGRADIVYASSTPLSVGAPGFFAAWIRRAPFVFEVRDLWPQSAVVAGALRPTAGIVRAAASFARFLYRRASRVIAVTRGIVQGLIHEGVPESKIILAPNGVDDWMLSAEPDPTAAAADCFEIVYAGAHGPWNGLMQILDAAALLRDRRDIRFVFIGDGDQRDALVERARAEGLTNVVFEGTVPKIEAFRRLQAASASIVVAWAHPFQKMILANKIFDYLAAGRPVLVAAHGEMAELVEEAGAGIAVAPERSDLLAEAILRLTAMSPEDRAEMGLRGRRHVIEHYQRPALARMLSAAFLEVRSGGTDH